jgi:hypothetical protein
MKADRIIRELTGDYPEELTAIGARLDVLGAELDPKVERRRGESDQRFSNRVRLGRAPRSLCR